MLIGNREEDIISRLVLLSLRVEQLKVLSFFCLPFSLFYSHYPPSNDYTAFMENENWRFRETIEIEHRFSHIFSIPFELPLGQSF